MLNYFERGLVPDWIRIGSGLVPDWIRIGGLTYNPGWIGSGFKILNPLRPLVLTRCQRYLSVPYLKEILIWPIYWRYLAGYLQLKY